MIYSHNGQPPKLLPHRIVLSNGLTRTNNTTFTEEELADADYILSTDKPIVDYPNYVSWNGSSWDILQHSQEKIEQDLLLEQKRKADALRQYKTDHINEILVTTTNGNIFDGHDEARANMNEAITASDILGVTTHNWKLADNTVVNISLDEIKEALALAIQAKGAIILGNK